MCWTYTTCVCKPVPSRSSSVNSYATHTSSVKRSANQTHSIIAHRTTQTSLEHATVTHHKKSLHLLFPNLHICLSSLLSVPVPATAGVAGWGPLLCVCEGPSAVLPWAPLPLASPSHEHSGTLGRLQRTVHLRRREKQLCLHRTANN